MLKTVNLLHRPQSFPLPPLPSLAGRRATKPHLLHSRFISLPWKVRRLHCGHIFPAILRPLVCVYVCMCVFDADHMVSIRHFQAAKAQRFKLSSLVNVRTECLRGGGRPASGTCRLTTFADRTDQRILRPIYSPKRVRQGSRAR